MVNEPNEIITPDALSAVESAFLKFCHRFFIPVVLPEQDGLRPNMAKVIPKIAHTLCIKEKCTLWNAETNECWDVTAAKGQAHAGEWAFKKSNNVLNETGGM